MTPELLTVFGQYVQLRQTFLSCGLRWGYHPSGLNNPWRMLCISLRSRGYPFPISYPTSSAQIGGVEMAVAAVAFLMNLI